jgi:CheY-like chemotaxis protein
MTNKSTDDGVKTSLRVLVVDDQPDSVESWALILRHAGHEVAVARDGKQAMEAANQQFPDAVLLDLWMPNLDGFQTAKQLLTTAPRRPLLIAMTGSCRDGDLRRCTEIGFDSVFIKPVDPHAVMQLLQDFAAARQAIP